MSEFKPCAHCGSYKHWEMVDGGCQNPLDPFQKKGQDLGFMVEIGCDVCKSRVYGFAHEYYEAIEDAYRRWNQRYERTCNRVIKNNKRPGKTVFNQWYACSECGNPMGIGENFCASCGAKVVE